MHDQPQRKRGGRSRPATAEELALRSAIATRQHAEARGYEIDPAQWRQYRNQFHLLRKHGLTKEEAWRTLQPQYAMEAAQ